MDIKYTGDLDEVIVRGVTFPKGKAVRVQDSLLAAKMLAWPDVEQAKRKKKNDKNSE